MAYPRFQRARDFKKTIGDATGNHTTTSTTLVDVGSYSISVRASVGDVLRIVFNCCITNSGTNTSYTRFNIAATDQGPGWSLPQEIAAYSKPLQMEHWHTVASGDIVSGTVTIKPRYRGSAATVTIFNEGTEFRIPVFAVQNLGPVDPN